MYISELEINNYKKLNGAKILFDERVNYIIGENGLGKSSILDAIDEVFNSNKIDEGSFGDDSAKVGIKIVIKEFFGREEDFKISFTQDIEGSIKLEANNKKITAKDIKKITFLNYKSTWEPSKKLKMNSSSGLSKVIIRLINTYYKNGLEVDKIINFQEIEPLINFMNNKLSNLEMSEGYNINLDIDKDKVDVIAQMFDIFSSDIQVNNMSSGFQYVTMAEMSLLSYIEDIFSAKKIKFEDRCYLNDEGEVVLPIIIGLDEPEIHLHPYLQRQLVDYYKNILSGNNDNFNILIKELYGVDTIQGQLLIVTHSSDILLDNYKNIIRLYKKGSKVEIKCGSSKEMSELKNNKHLIMSFAEIKEVFFGKCAIIVEGETEYGCISTFAKKMNISLDKYGITVIMARGEGSINPIKDMLYKFGIKSVAIYDGDVKKKNTSSNIFYTEGLCIEFDIAEKMIRENKGGLLKQLIVNCNNVYKKQKFDTAFFDKYNKKTNLSIVLEPPRKMDDINEENVYFKDFCVACLLATKGVITGRIISESMDEKTIPEAYKQAIKKAVEISKE